MHEEVYADGIGEITVTGSIVRINLVSLSPTEKDERNNPKPVLRQRIIMPVEAFANAVDLMQSALTGLVDAGAIRRINPGTRAVSPVAEVGAARNRPAESSNENSSPNFN